MLLDNEQLQGLIDVLEPKFQTVQQRRIALQEAFQGEIAPVTDLNKETTEQFTTTLVHNLTEHDLHLASGELAVVRLIESLQATYAQDALFAKTVQPYLEILRNKNGNATKDGSPEALVTSGVRMATGPTNPPPTGPTHSADTNGDSGSSSRKRRRRHRSTPTQRVLKRVRKTFKLQLVLLIVIVIVVILGAGSLALVTDANAQVQDAWSGLKRVVNTMKNRSLSDLTLNDFQRLGFSLDDMTKSLSRAKQQTSFLKLFSSMRRDVAATFTTLDVANEVSMAASDMLAGLQPTLFFIIKGGSDGTSGVSQLSAGERIVELLQVGQGSLLSADKHLTNAEAEISTLHLDNLPPSLLLTTQDLISYEQQIRDADKILLDAPTLLTKAFGLDDAQDYLVLSQNSDELRPSGGFISTYGWMQIRRVRITDYGYEPSTDTSPNPPPAALASQLKIPDWWIQRAQPIYTAWDGSWYADFPATAEMAAWYYDNGNNPRSPVNGVVSIDIYGFEYLLQGLGGINVPDYNEQVTPDNFREVVYRIRTSGQGDEPHKKFLAALYREILKEWQNAPADSSAKLLNATLRALREKHIMIYFKDPKLNDVMNLLGWSGAQTPTATNDYLMIVDANLSNKSNSSIDRQITYDVTIQDNGSLQSRTAVAYDYAALTADKDPAVKPQNYNDINYINDLQLFVPLGSSITETRNLQSKVDTIKNDKYTGFVTLTKVNYDSTERFQFSYTSPNRVETFGPYRRYRLLLQKQPGTAGDSVSVQVTLPTGATTISVSPDPVANYILGQPVLEFKTRLTTDQWIEIVYTQ